MKKYPIIFTASAAMCACLVCGVAFGVTANADEVWNTDGTELAETYRIGETVSLPDYTLEYNGKTAAAERSLHFPDGTATHEKEVELSKAGDYTVYYNAVIDGKVFSRSLAFTADYKSYYFTGANSVATYGAYTEYGCSSTGLQVRLGNGESLIFTRFVDVESLTKDDMIIQGFITPDQRGGADFDKLTVTLTDAKDPSVYLRFDLNRWTGNDSGKGYTFVSAGGNGQDMVGYEDKGSNSKLHVNDNVGTPAIHSWTAQGSTAWGVAGAYDDFVPDSYLIDVRFDAAEMRAYVNNSLISDLDDAFYYSSLWSGFKSGKARISVSASGYSSQTANFCLTKVFGVDLGNELFFDTEAPVIEVQTEYGELPEGAVGVAYPVPAAVAYDDYSGETEVNVSVLYNFSSETPTSVEAENGAFLPLRKGWYQIVYSSCDAFGNRSQTGLAVHVGSQIDPLTVIPPEEKQESVTLGDAVTIAQPVIGGGSGNKNLSVSVSGGGESFDIAENADGTFSFRPDAEGGWVVTYTVTDYLGNEAQCSYTVEAVRGDKPVFVDLPEFAPVYVSGAKYFLPEIYANDYTSGRLERKLCRVRVTASDGTVAEYDAGDEFVPVANAARDILTIRYVCGDAFYETEVPVILAREGKVVYVRNYFYGEGFTLSDTDDNGAAFDKGLQLTAVSASEKTGWVFANAQIADGFTFAFSTLAEKTKFTSLRITLADEQDSSVAVALDVKMNASSTVLTCGDYTAALSYSFRTEARSASVSFTNGNFVFDSLKLPAVKTLSGEAFSSFPSGKAWVTVEMLGAEAGAAYKIDSVSGNTITGMNADYGKPTISVSGLNGGNKTIGSEYVLYPAVAGDAFAPNVSLSVTVTDPNGEIVSDANGLKLENVPTDTAYTILLNVYGSYKVNYSAKETDWVGNSRTYANYILVIDEEAPVITLTSGYSENAKVGDVIVLPDFKVTDNVTEAENITVTRSVLSPTGKLILLKGNSNSIKCDYEGVYVFRIMAQDEFGNVSSMNIAVTVTKGGEA